MDSMELLGHPLFIGLDERTMPKALRLLGSSEKAVKKGEAEITV